MLRRYLPFLLAVLALLLLFAGDACAADGGPVLAFSLGKYLSGLATRSRVIQVAAVGMIIALLIIMKK
jgi:hypothetical protein